MSVNKGVIALGCVLCLSLGGYGAYALYIDNTETVKNAFTIKPGGFTDNVGSIVEENWNPANATALQPNQTVAKDPKFVCASAYDGWIFLEVGVPNIEVILEGKDTAETVPCVSLEGLDTANWTLVETDTSNPDGTWYIYGYNQPISNSEETTNLFTGIKVPDIKQLDTTTNADVVVQGLFYQDAQFTSVTDAYNNMLGYEIPEETTTAANGN